MTTKLSLASALIFSASIYCVSTASGFQPAPTMIADIGHHLLDSVDFDERLSDLSRQKLIPGYHDLDPRDRFDVAPLVRPRPRSEFQVPHYHSIPDVRRQQKIA